MSSATDSTPGIEGGTGIEEVSRSPTQLQDTAEEVEDEADAATQTALEDHLKQKRTFMEEKHPFSESIHLKDSSGETILISISSNMEIRNSELGLNSFRSSSNTDAARNDLFRNESSLPSFLGLSSFISGMFAILFMALLAQNAINAVLGVSLTVISLVGALGLLKAWIDFR